MVDPINNTDVVQPVCGYRFYDNANRSITFFIGDKECLKLSPVPEGFDVIVPDGVTMTEAAADFIYVLKTQMRYLWKTAGETNGNG